MPCSSGERHRLSPRGHLEATPTPELLRQLDAAVRKAMEAAAAAALTELASERIYGFFLMHYIFRSCRAAVLTEARLASSSDKADRWSPADCGHYFYREDLFDEPNRLLAPLENRGQEDEVARIFARAVLHVRRHVIPDARIVLSVMDYTEGPGVPFFAYAELFNDAATLSQLRAELQPGPHWHYLDLERSRVPSLSGAG